MLTWILSNAGSVLAAIVAILGAGAGLFAAGRSNGKKTEQVRQAEKAEQRAHTERQQVVDDAMARSAAESEQRQQGGAADRLRDSHWMRDSSDD